jgi:hypothetical protein
MLAADGQHISIDILSFNIEGKLFTKCKITDFIIGWPLLVVLYGFGTTICRDLCLTH